LLSIFGVCNAHLPLQAFYLAFLLRCHVVSLGQLISEVSAVSLELLRLLPLPLENPLQLLVLIAHISQLR
jgi:hypothetical protein